MIINRNNYEEFFLMYVDNELSAADRNAVDLFVQENPDLQEELQMLQDTVLSPFEISFDDKDALLKPDAAMQEKLLLHLDNELNAADKRAVQSLIGTDNAAAAEWNLLQQTKLAADTSIRFTDKESLYRKEQSKVVGMHWWRIAAAAMLIGFGTWGMVSFLNSDKTTGTETAGTLDSSVIKNNTTAGNTTNPVKNNIVTNDPIVTPVTADTKEPLVKNPVVKEAENKTVPVKEENKIVPNKITNDNIAVNTPDDKPTNNLPTPLQNINRNLQKESNNSIIANVTPTERNEIIIPDKIKTAINTLVNNNTQKSNVIAVANKTNETATEPDDDDEGDGRKSKFRGLFRKVKRVLERNTKVNTGNGNNTIKVAGFGIAI